ncbi:MAG TPA: CYTH domain-containing protein [Bacteroidetes bacterium]|nr:CYTH domain-containing protein [Bacteroidota bacterium]
MKNIELKARCDDACEAESQAKGIGAIYQWRKRQTDTYFRVPNGRLKMREEDGKIPQLISYFRADRPGERESEYQLLNIPESSTLKKMLSGTLGVLVVVKKTRTLFLYENVRIHLDQVESLGDFIEFEGVIRNAAGVEDTQKKILRLKKQFAIAEADLVKYSYSDLLMRLKGQRDYSTKIAKIAEFRKRLLNILLM